MYLLMARDDTIDYPYVAPIPSKRPVDVRNALAKILGATVPKSIRTDNGGEFEKEFADWLAVKGIVHPKSLPYRPQTNARAARWNRTLGDGIRTLLTAYGMPYSFWGEAAR